MAVITINEISLLIRVLLIETFGLLSGKKIKLLRMAKSFFFLHSLIIKTVAFLVSVCSVLGKRFSFLGVKTLFTVLKGL